MAVYPMTMEEYYMMQEQMQMSMNQQGEEESIDLDSQEHIEESLWLSN